MAKLVLKICVGTWANASRDKRELSVCKELGFDTLVLAKGQPDDHGRQEIVDGYQVLRLNVVPFGVKMLRPINRVASLFSWAHYAADLKPDIISGHDLPGVLIGWMACRIIKKRCMLVYDSHEFEIGRNTSRSRFQTWGITHLERFLIRRCAFTIIENQLIADELVKVHKLKNTPVVARSTPDCWEIDSEACSEVRQRILNALDADVEHLLMYHGAMTTGRGIELLLKLIAERPKLGLLMVGPSEQSYLAKIQEIVHTYKIENRVYIHEAVPHEELWKYLGAADISMALIEPVSRSYELTLPNKVLESIQALTPLIMSELPGMTEINNEFHVGLTCDPNSLESVIKCVDRLLDDKILYTQVKTNLTAAKEVLCWENEKTKLKTAYQAFL